MIDDFTPTTEQVRDGYASDPEAEYRDPVGYGSYEQRLRRAFDRWLADRDKAVRQATLKEAAEAARGVELTLNDIDYEREVVAEAIEALAARGEGA